MHAHSRGKSPPLIAMCRLQGERAWAVHLIGVPFGVLWSHILGIYIGGGSAEVGLEWDAGTCVGLP